MENSAGSELLTGLNRVYGDAGYNRGFLWAVQDISRLVYLLVSRFLQAFESMMQRVPILTLEFAGGKSFPKP